jgi:AcrR family transcriptional regulator
MNTQEKILHAAKTSFAKKGFKGTSVRDICLEANVASSAIHYHFKNKEGLLQYLFESFGEKQLEATWKILDNPKTFDEVKIRLEMFLDSVLSSFLEDPALFRLVQKEIEDLNPNIEETFKNTFLKIVERMIDFLEKSKKKGIIDKKINSQIAVKYLLNHICGQVRSDDLNKRFFNLSLKDPTYRKFWIEQSLYIFLKGIKNEVKNEPRRTLN